MAVILEGLVMSFWLLLVCVIGIANGPAEMVCIYEKDVQERAVELGLTTREKIKRANTLAALAIFLPQMFVVPTVVALYNGVSGFWNGFGQIFAVYMISNLFDRLFIDEWWVGRTKAWVIPGTEDLVPYIPMKQKLVKWIGAPVLFAIIAAAASGIIQLIGLKFQRANKTPIFQKIPA